MSRAVDAERGAKAVNKFRSGAVKGFAKRLIWG